MRKTLSTTSWGSLTQTAMISSVSKSFCWRWTLPTAPLVSCSNPHNTSLHTSLQLRKSWTGRSSSMTLTTMVSLTWKRWRSSWRPLTILRASNQAKLRTMETETPITSRRLLRERLRCLRLSTGTTTDRWRGRSLWRATPNEAPFYDGRMQTSRNGGWTACCCTDPTLTGGDAKCHQFWRDMDSIDCSRIIFWHSVNREVGNSGVISFVCSLINSRTNTEVKSAHRDIYENFMFHQWYYLQGKTSIALGFFSWYCLCWH